MMMKNLQRAAEIAAALPVLKQARQDLSDNPACMSVNGNPLPPSFAYRVLNALNLEINELESEVKDL